MKTTVLRRLLGLAAIVLLALLAVAGCGDDDGGGTDGDRTALTTYFDGVEEIFGDALEATSEAEDRLNDAADAPLNERLAALDTYLEEIDVVFGEAVRRLHDMNAPSLASEGHERFIDGVEDSMAAGDELRDDIPDISTEEQLEERLSEFDGEVEDAVEASEEACLELQMIADEQGIDVDLDCEG